MGQGLQKVGSGNKLAEWAERITECRESGESVKAWCGERGICEQTYYRWQRKLRRSAEQNRCFAEVRPMQPVRSGGAAVRVRIGGAEIEIANGADAGTVELVLRVLGTC